MPNPASYPARFPLRDAERPWTVPLPSYRPPYFVAPVVIANDVTVNPRGWADPENIANVTRTLCSFEGAVHRDGMGHPLNPRGRTGLAGRGVLGKWGANFAADQVITRLNPANERLELLVIRRRDSGMWAFPGGMVDGTESPEQTAARELEEEAGIHVDMRGAQLVFRGFVAEGRNTDNAWMETTALLHHLTADEASTLTLKAGDDATDARWIELTDDAVAGLHASHGAIARAARAMIRENGDSI